MSFYGYEPGAYTPNFSWIESIGKDLSKIPEAVAVEKELNEGKIQNTDIYTGLKQIAEGIDDEEFQKAYGMPKQQFMRMAKPGKNEKPDQYMSRAYLLTKDGNAKMSTLRGNDSFTKEVLARAQGLGAPYSETEKAGVAAEGMTHDTIGALEAIPSQKRPGYDDFIKEGGTPKDYTGMFGEVPKPQAEPLTPTGIQAIGAKHGVSKEIMDPYIADAEQAIAERQITGLGDAKNRTEAYGKAIKEGPIGSATEKALATVPTVEQLAGIDFKQKTLEAKSQASKDNAIYKAKMLLLNEKKAAAKTTEQKKLLETEVMKLKTDALNAKAKILSGISDDINKLGMLEKTSWEGADPEIIGSAADAIKEIKLHADSYNPMIEGYQKILDELSVGTIQQKPAGGGAAQPKTSRKPLSERWIK